MKLENFNRYQSESRKTWHVIPMNHPIVYPNARRSCPGKLGKTLL